MKEETGQSDSTENPDSFRAVRVGLALSAFLATFIFVSTLVWITAFSSLTKVADGMDTSEVAISAVEKKYQIDDVKLVDTIVRSWDLYANDISYNSQHFEGNYKGKKIMFAGVLDEETGTARILLLGDGSVTIKDLLKS